MKDIIFFSIVILLCSSSCCLMTEYEDVTSDREYADLIGKSYLTLNEMYLTGVTMERNYEKILHHYAFSDFKFGGPEVLSRDMLPAYTIVTITNIWRNTDCSPRTKEVVFKIPSTERFDDAPIFFDFKEFVNKGDKYFEPI